MASKGKKKAKTIEDVLATVSVTRETLEDTTDRAIKLVRGIGTSRVIRAIVMDRGYTQAIHAKFWKLIRLSCGTADDDTLIEVEDPEVRASIQFVDARDELFFQILTATFKHNFPEQGAFVLKGGLGPSTGIQSVVNMGIALDRLDVLESGPERKATRPQDHAALALLAERKIDKAARDELRKHVTAAELARPVSLDDVTASEDPEMVRLEAQVELRKLYEEWSEIAKATIKRRDYLIRLGLATRRSPTQPEEPEPVVGETPPEK